MENIIRPKNSIVENFYDEKSKSYARIKSNDKCFVQLERFWKISATMNRKSEILWKSQIEL